MQASPFSRMEKFIKELPVIRSVPGFNTLPPSVTPYNLRFYKLGNLVYTLGLAIHATWVTLFFLLDVKPLAIINIVSVGVYILTIAINRRGHHFSAAVIMICEIILHQLFAIRMVGWEGGFQYYVIVISMLPFLMPKGKWVIKLVLLAACLFTYIMLDYMIKNQTPLYSIPHGFLTYFKITNIVFSFTSMAISGGYFNIAMHETEAKLEHKSAELVEAEKKATLGRIAAEMAHEIQNPLNFVNNFAAMNEEFLRELKKELAVTGVSASADALMNDLIINSERIRLNGRRVSVIVQALHDQVRNGEK